MRVTHWSLVGCVALAWFTHGAAHEGIGYAVLAVVVLRFAWGWAGPRTARFSQFVRGPARTLAYAKAVLAHREPRYLGHNPLGAWMIVALLAALALVGATGWLSTTDPYWGVQWVQELHELCADALLALVALHVAGVILASLRHRENLVRSMVTGTKAPPGVGDVFE